MAKRIYDSGDIKSSKRNDRKKQQKHKPASKDVFVNAVAQIAKSGKNDSKDKSRFGIFYGKAAAQPSSGPAAVPDSSDGITVSDYTGVRAFLNPLWCNYGFRLAVVMLTCFGVVMVFSASSVTMIAANLSPWKQALSQGVYCILGLVICYAATRAHADFYRKISFWFVVFSIVLQLMTMTPLGVEVNGNKGWIGIRNVFTMQPAEVMKLALCIWMPWAIVTATDHFKKEGFRAYGPSIIVFLVCLATVMLGGDLGTALILVAIGVTAMLVGGFPTKWLVTSGLALLAAVLVFVVTSPNRMLRITAAYRPCPTTALQGECYQAMHAKYAMASGGFFGVGIGNSREKWNYLPEAHNDFIFAIIGEETGFIGAAIVILLFVVLGWCMFSIALQTPDKYASRVLICIAIWIVGQALVNIMVVIGLLPVMGVPLPFVSAGGSSLVMCLSATGVAVSMMKLQPQIRADVTALSL